MIDKEHLAKQRSTACALVGVEECDLTAEQCAALDAYMDAYRHFCLVAHTDTVIAEVMRRLRRIASSMGYSIYPEKRQLPDNAVAYYVIASAKPRKRRCLGRLTELATMSEEAITERINQRFAEKHREAR